MEKNSDTNENLATFLELRQQRYSGLINFHIANEVKLFAIALAGLTVSGIHIAASGDLSGWNLWLTRMAYLISLLPFFALLSYLVKTQSTRSISSAYSKHHLEDFEMGRREFLIASIEDTELGIKTVLENASQRMLLASIWLAFIYLSLLIVISFI